MHSWSELQDLVILDPEAQTCYNLCSAMFVESRLSVIVRSDIQIPPNLLKSMVSLKLVQCTLYSTLQSFGCWHVLDIKI